MNALAFPWRLSSARTTPILARSIASLLAPVGLILTTVITAPSARANDTVTFSGGKITDTLGVANDFTIIGTNTSGSTIEVQGSGISNMTFDNVTFIDTVFTAAIQTANFDFQTFSTTPQVTINAGFGAATDAVVIDGGSGNTITFTGTNTYGGGTSIYGGVLIVNNSGAVGTGPVTLTTGTELRASGNITLTDPVKFAVNTTGATLSATAGSTLTLSSFDPSNTSALTFGSTGNTGTVVIGTVTAATNLTSLTVAFGTLADGGDLGSLTDDLAAPTTTVDAGATLALRDLNLAVNNLEGAGSVTLGSKSSTMLTLGSATNFSGVISGAGQVTTVSAVTFTGNNTYTGLTTIGFGAILQLGNGGTTGAIAGNVFIGSSAELIFDRSNASTYSGVISGLGFVAQAGTGILTLSGKNSYSGGTQITSGGLVVTNNNALGTGAVTLSSGAELRGSGTVTLNNAVNFASNTSGATFSAAPGGTLTLSNLDATNTGGLIFGSSGNTGTVVIGSTVTGGPNLSYLTVAFGTLANGGKLGNLTFASGLPTTTVDTGATLALRDINTEIEELRGTGAVNLGTKASTVLTLSSGDFGGVISGAGQVVINAVVSFTGADTYTGGTTINGVPLQLGKAGTTGSIAGNVSVTSGGVLEFDRSNADTFSGVISGAGSVIQEGTSILTLTGKNTYSGGTQITSGDLVVTNNNALGTGPVTLSTGTELRASGTVTLNTNTVNFATGTTNATLSAAPGGTFTLNELDTTNTTGVTFGSAGNTGAVVIGPTVTAGTNLTSLTVAFGTLKNGGGLGTLTDASAVTTTTVKAGATLSVNDISTTVSNLAGSGLINLGTKATTILMLNGGTFSGVISGSGQVDAAAVIFTGNDTYTGGTTILPASKLSVGDDGTTGSIAGNVSIDSTGELDFIRTNAYTFSGIISGAGFVDGGEGGGVLTLTGNNTYQGGTNMAGGAAGAVLEVTNNNALGTGAVTLHTGAELRGSGTVTLNNTVNFATGTTNATLSATPGGTFTLNNLDASNTTGLTIGSAGHTGTVVIGQTVTAGTNLTSLTVAFGTLKNGGGLTTLTDAPGVTTTVNAGATLSLNDLSTTIGELAGAGNVTLGTKSSTIFTVNTALLPGFGGVISGAGQLEVTGFVLLTGASTYTGETTIDASDTLQLGNGTPTGSIVGNVSIASGGLLAFDRNNPYTFSGLISGTGAVQQIGTGVLTLSGKSTYTGGTQIKSGVLAFTNASALGNGPVTLSAGTELRGSGTITLADPITFSGSGDATISTNGTLTLPNLTVSGPVLLLFGSSGNAGTVSIPSGGTLSAAAGVNIEVAFGTLSNGGGLNTLTSSTFQTQVDKGATISLGDFNTTINSLLGAGKVTLGTKSSTVLTLDGASFQGTISGAGQVKANTTSGSGLVEFQTANTYTGGTTVSAGALVANNSSGSATGTGPVTIDSGAVIGGSGTVSGPMTLDSGGTVQPGVNEFNTPGTKFHGSSLLMEGGSTLDFQIGSITDELLLTGALTKGTAGTFTINIENDTIVTGNYTLATFASTTFSLSDFTLDLPNGVSGILVENTKSLVLDITQAELPAHSEETSAPADSDLATASVTDPTPGSSFTPSDTLQPTPEPGSALLLAFGGSILLGLAAQALNEAAEPGSE